MSSPQCAAAIVAQLLAQGVRDVVLAHDGEIDDMPIRQFDLLGFATGVGVQPCLAAAPALIQGTVKVLGAVLCQITIEPTEYMFDTTVA